MTAYYNEIDPFAAAWLRELIKHGLIAPGHVDERSIADVRAADLVGFTQVHFFAGIGGWSLAARLAGWPDDRPLWTGSAPCQPFSTAGKQRGTDDERHLWPIMRDLVAVCRPAVVAGEQVASGPGLDWLASVRSDLEAEGYAVGAADLCAAGTGAPHLRQRLYWGGVRVADAGSSSSRRDAGAVYPTETGVGCEGLINGTDSLRYQYGRAACGMADTDRKGLAQRNDERRDHNTEQSSVEQGCSYDDRLANLPSNGRGEGDALFRGRDQGGDEDRLVRPSDGGNHHGTDADYHGWGRVDWLFCRDAKWRPVRSGSFPLAHGVPGRVGRLRGYGNAIVPQVAATFLRALVGDLP